MATYGISRWDWWRADPGHTFYLPDLYYFPAHAGAPHHEAEISLAQAARVTARCVARWSGNFRATPTYRRTPVREGSLPSTPDEREAFLDELFRWFEEESTEPDFCAEMSLWDGEHWLMDAHDGFPGPLHLSPDQFDLLRERLERAGLPPDLYFPIHEQRVTVGPVALRNGVVRGRRFYSPQEWAHRDRDAIASLRVPTEDERRDAFIAACESFMTSVSLRSQELSEPGKDLRSDELRQMGDLHAVVADALRSTYARRHGLTAPDATRRLGQHEPMAGWRQVPSAFEALSAALPALRRLHGDEGFVWWLASAQVRADEEIAEWTLYVWLPEPQRSLRYRLFNGVLFGPPSVLNEDASTRPRIWPLGQDTPPTLIDSQEALARAAEAGGQGFLERERGQLGAIRLTGQSDDDLAWLVSYSRWYPPAALHVGVGARTGEVLTIQKEPPGPPPPPAL